MMEEKHTITMANGTKVHMTLNAQANGRLDLVVNDIEPPKPQYEYSDFKHNIVQSESSIPFLWKENERGLPVFLRIIEFMDDNAKRSLALVMTDKFGKILKNGFLLKFRSDDDTIRLIPCVGDQYPAVKGLNGEVGLAMAAVFDDLKWLKKE